MAVVPIWAVMGLSWNILSGYSGYVSFGSITGSYNKTTDEYKLKLSIGGSGIDTSGGMITLKERSNASTKVQYLKYTSAVLSGGDYFFTIKGEVIYTPDHLERTAYVSKFDLTEGDSELTTDPRLKYEMFRNALAEIEQFTPDYIVPCGIYFNETDKFTKTTSHSTSLTKVVTEGDPVKITVDGAAIWRSTGNVDINDGTFVDQHIYTSIQEVTNDDGTVDYDVNLSSAGPFSITSVVASGDTTFNLNTPTLTGTAANAMLKKLRDSGYLKLDNNLIKYTKVAFATDDASYVTITRDITGGNAVLLSAVASGYKQIKGINSSYGTYDITHSYVESVNRELGIGYVKETDIGGSYTFEWSNELGKDKNGKASGDYNLAHFGYLLANFCSESAIGSNTPICGMNIDVTNVAASNFSRNAIVNWIGTMPSYKNVAGTDSVSQVLATGTGLLGDPVMAGSYNYNRATLADPSSGIVADPGLGLMLTSEGGIDGSLARDNFGVLVDLGKFMVVGAGLLTFSNGASITSYIDACGIYALGMLSGKPTNEGISFSRIGQTSNTTVSVVVHRKYYNDLARMKFIVPTRERGLGWVLNNGDSAARTDSQYKLISTTRIIKTIVEKKRALLSTFIGKALNQYYYEAAKTKLADSFKTDVVEGLINGFKFDLQVEDVAAAIGKLYLKIAINPPFELTQVTIDTVIDRSVTNTK